MLLLLGDGTSLPVAELPGAGPWTFLVLRRDPVGDAAPPAPTAGAAGLGGGGSGPMAEGAGAVPAAGVSARLLTRYGRVVVPDLRERPGFGAAPGEPGFLGLVDDLDQVRTRAGLGRPVLVGLGELAPLALRAGVDQPWAWRALVLAPGHGRRPAPADLAALDLPTLVLGGAGPGPAPDEVDVVEVGAHSGGQSPAAALERLLGRLGTGPGWAGIAPDAPPR